MRVCAIELKHLLGSKLEDQRSTLHAIVPKDKR